MIRRIVHMTFQPDKLDLFLGIFESSREAIRSFPGCHELTLLQATDDPCGMVTYSLWDDEAALNAYRQSDLFKATWAKTKVLFADKPRARSYLIRHHLG